jgi:hypothetical protein
MSFSYSIFNQLAELFPIYVDESISTGFSNRAVSGYWILRFNMVPPPDILALGSENGHQKIIA